MDNSGDGSLRVKKKMMSAFYAGQQKKAARVKMRQEIKWKSRDKTAARRHTICLMVH